MLAYFGHIKRHNTLEKNYSWRAHVRVGEAEGDPEGDGRRTLANGWESRLWRLEDKHLREGSSVRQFGRPRPLRIRHRRRRCTILPFLKTFHFCLKIRIGKLSINLDCLYSLILKIYYNKLSRSADLKTTCLHFKASL